MNSKIKNIIYILMEVILVAIDVCWFVLIILATGFDKSSPINYILVCGLFTLFALLSHLFYFLVVMGIIRFHKENGGVTPKGEISSYGDTVYLCKEFPDEDYFVNHLHKIFGLSLRTRMVYRSLDSLF